MLGGIPFFAKPPTLSATDVPSLYVLDYLENNIPVVDCRY